MSKIEVDKIDPQSGTDLELGTSGDTITIPAGVTFDSSAATNTLPATVVTTTGTQTLTNKSIATTQLTGTITPSDSTVSTAKIVDGAVTSAKLASGVGGVAGITSSSTSGTALNITSGNDLEISDGKKISFLSTPPAINIDCSSVTVTLTNGSSIDFVSNSGIYCICEQAQSGQTAIYVAGAGSVNLLQTNTLYSATSGSGSFRFFVNAPTSAFRLQNNQGNTCVFAIFNLKLRNST